MLLLVAVAQVVLTMVAEAVQAVIVAVSMEKPVAVVLQQKVN